MLCSALRLPVSLSVCLPVCLVVRACVCLRLHPYSSRAWLCRLLPFNWSSAGQEITDSHELPWFGRQRAIYRANSVAFAWKLNSDWEGDRSTDRPDGWGSTSSAQNNEYSTKDRSNEWSNESKNQLSKKKSIIRSFNRWTTDDGLSERSDQLRKQWVKRILIKRKCSSQVYL